MPFIGDSGGGVELALVLLMVYGLSAHVAKMMTTQRTWIINEAPRSVYKAI